MKRKTLSTLALLAVATPALAGEITGTGESTPIRSGTANSICAYSGLNDDGLGPSTLVQAYGVIVAALGQPLPPVLAPGGRNHPGNSCSP